MSQSSQQDFVASQYAPRAEAYLASPVHATGADLDDVEALVRGRPEARVLDLGCGGGHVALRAAPHVAEMVACDLTPDMLAVVAEAARARGLGNLAVRQAAAEALPFEAASFDLVLCRFSAHHWSDLEAGLREARRVLRPEGAALFIDTVAPADPLLDTYLQTIERLRDTSHGRNYTVAEWVAALARARLAVNGVTLRRLRMEFASWTERTRTPPVLVQALRALQAGAAPDARRHFAIEPDGSFILESASLSVLPV